MAKNTDKKSLLRSFIFDGLLLLALGIAVVIWPDKALNTLCIVVGAVIAAIGLIRCIVYFVNKNEDRQIVDLLMGILQFGIGLALIIARGFFVDVFFIVIGVILLFGSTMMLLRALRLRYEKGITFVSAIAFGCVTLVLAIVILINPSAFAKFITRLQGIALIIEGLGMIFVLRKPKEITKAKEEAE